MKASEILNAINVNDSISIVYHKCADDRRNPQNGQFRSFVNVTVTEIYAAKSGAIQVKFPKPEGGIGSFTSEAIVKSLAINQIAIVKDYELV